MRAGPRGADPVPHRPHHRVVVDHHADIAGEKQIGEGREGEVFFVEGPSNRPRRLLEAVNHHLDQRLGRQFGELLTQRLGRNHIHRPRGEELAGRWLLEHVHEEIGDFVNFGESLHDRFQAGVLTGTHLEANQIIIEKVLPVSRGDGFEFFAWGVNEHGLERADFGGNANGRHRLEANYLLARAKLSASNSSTKLTPLTVTSSGTTN